MRSVLDTSVLIGSTLDRLDGEFTISVVSIAELQFGVLIAPSESQRAHRLARLSATALAHKARLVTANIKDVQHLDQILEIVEVE